MAQTGHSTASDWDSGSQNVTATILSSVFLQVNLIASILFAPGTWSLDANVPVFDSGFLVWNE